VDVVVVCLKEGSLCVRIVAHTAAASHMLQLQQLARKPMGNLKCTSTEKNRPPDIV
jgi:hypothetical protein